MHSMMQKMCNYNYQSIDEEDRSYASDHNKSSSFDDDFHDRRLQRRRRSSITAYELNPIKKKQLPKSTTMVVNRASTAKHAFSTLDQIALSRKVSQIRRRSTIHRLDSLSSRDSSLHQIQSNEYTSITDGK